MSDHMQMGFQEGHIYFYANFEESAREVDLDAEVKVRKRA